MADWRRQARDNLEKNRNSYSTKARAKKRKIVFGEAKPDVVLFGKTFKSAYVVNRRWPADRSINLEELKLSYTRHCYNSWMSDGRESDGYGGDVLFNGWGCWRMFLGLRFCSRLC